MLTEEQIKNLKEGDKLIAEVSFISVDEVNDLECMSYITDSVGDVVDLPIFLHRSCLSLPPAEPKYDPYRKLKKGDLVTPTQVNGRNSRGINGEIYRVCQDELESGCEIKLSMDGCIGHITVDAAYLELVTPVEEQETYFVLDSPHAFNICKHGGGKSVAMFYKDHPHAREHAEKYCAALNAEHRKELK